MMGILPSISDLLKPVKDIVSEVVVDKDKRDQVNLELAKIEDQAQARLDAQVTGQLEVNKVEAANDSVFVAGWRPAVGWIGAAGLAWSTLLSPMFSWVATVAFKYQGAFPNINNDALLTVLLGMLGLGGLRTVEKVKGVAGTGALETKAPQTETGAATPVATPVQKPKKKSWSPF